MQITPPFTSFDAGILILAFLIAVMVAPFFASPKAKHPDDDEPMPEQDIERRYRQNEGAAE